MPGHGGNYNCSPYSNPVVHVSPEGGGQTTDKHKNPDRGHKGVPGKIGAKDRGQLQRTRNDLRKRDKHSRDAHKGQHQLTGGMPGTPEC
jgi:hypothetical protein